MAEAANECVVSIIQNCHSHRLLPTICTAVCTDRNPKLRQHCATYLLQVLLGNIAEHQHQHRPHIACGEVGE